MINFSNRKKRESKESEKKLIIKKPFSIEIVIEAYEGGEKR